MWKQGCVVLLLIFSGLLMPGCLGTVWTGASVFYDRHHAYQRLNDYNLLISLNKELAVNRTFNNGACLLDIAAFNGDILVAGHLPSIDLWNEMRERLARVKGYRRMFVKVAVKQVQSNTLEDTWITTKIRTAILADSHIDPKAFKVVTSDSIVYLMGDVKSEQAARVVKIARQLDGVNRVVKLFRYFTYQSDSQMTPKAK